MTGRGRDIGCRRAIPQDLLPKGTRRSILRRGGGMEAGHTPVSMRNKTRYTRDSGCRTNSGQTAWSSYD